jgi:hypothetical protein
MIGSKPEPTVLETFLLVFSMKALPAPGLGIVAIAAAAWHYRTTPALSSRRIGRRLRQHESDLRAAGLQRTEPQRVLEPKVASPLLL